jgi:hypothetical protein
MDIERNQIGDASYVATKKEALSEKDYLIRTHHL